MLRRKLKLFIYRIYRRTIRRTNPRLLIFESNLGRSCGGNPKAIYEELVRRGLDKKYRIIWIFVEPEKNTIPGRCEKLCRESLPALCKMQCAAAWITDTRQPQYIVKNPKTFYLMTWHGTPLKRLGFDLDTHDVTWRDQLEQDVSQWDCLLAQNRTGERLLRQCFSYRGDVLCGGYPRNDVLCGKKQRDDAACREDLKGDKTSEEKKECGKYGLPADRRIILYAPTWREYESEGECNGIFCPPLDLDKVYEAVREDSIFLIKYHCYIRKKPDLSRFHGVIRDTDLDISELYPISDVLITDYSSVMFDYAILNRPMIFYAYDLQHYEKTQGFYFNFREFVPGPVATTTEELLSYLKPEYNFADFQDRMAAFREEFVSQDDGRASERTVDLLLNSISK